MYQKQTNHYLYVAYSVIYIIVFFSGVDGRIDVGEKNVLAVSKKKANLPPLGSLVEKTWYRQKRKTSAFFTQENVETPCLYVTSCNVYKSKFKKK